MERIKSQIEMRMNVFQSHWYVIKKTLEEKENTEKYNHTCYHSRKINFTKVLHKIYERKTEFKKKLFWYYLAFKYSNMSRLP